MPREIIMPERLGKVKVKGEISEEILEEVKSQGLD
jgi:hypothetical protein